MYIADTVPNWQPFQRVPNANAIALGLQKIPKHWSLTPLQDKSPRREHWQTEGFVPHSQIAELILRGERRTSKKGNDYTCYWSGYGLRTGEASGGLLAIDVDGVSAQPLLDAIAGTELPHTVKWSSGKPGRYQLLFQLPDEIRRVVGDFNRAALNEWSGLLTARDGEGKPTELLEFRYNRSQSCLPPSRHPTTGAYGWINSPDKTEVAIAPGWLCDLIVSLASEEKQQKESQRKRAIEWAELQKQAKFGQGAVTNLIDFLDFEVLPRLSPDQIFNWTGHGFRQFGKTLKGTPPWRQSSSGTSFHVWWDGSKWSWQDKATSEGGGAVQYRYKLRGGTGTPKGKEFYEIVKELAEDAGVKMPEIKKEIAPPLLKTKEYKLTITEQCEAFLIRISVHYPDWCKYIDYTLEQKDLGFSTDLHRYAWQQVVDKEIVDSDELRSHLAEKFSHLSITIIDNIIQITEQDKAEFLTLQQAVSGRIALMERAIAEKRAAIWWESLQGKDPLTAEYQVAYQKWRDEKALIQKLDQQRKIN